MKKTKEKEHIRKDHEKHLKDFKRSNSEKANKSDAGCEDCNS